MLTGTGEFYHSEELPRNELVFVLSFSLQRRLMEKLQIHHFTTNIQTGFSNFYQ